MLAETLPIADGAQAYVDGFCAGLMPDPDLWIDEWSDRYMMIPQGNGAEHGPYRTSRTPYAREVMRALSPAHPARRVVCMVASQLLKTQVGINWLAASIHQAPGNMLVLLPTLNLSKRVSGRIGKTIDAVPELKERVAQPRSRDSRNTIDTKEFAGGTLYITTAGSAANLAEIAARYVYGDEIDRWEVSVDQEGDPIELAETRTSTFGRNAKIYYTSSPTVEGASRIATLFKQSDQRHFEVPCPHCEAFQTLEWENLSVDVDLTRCAYVCTHCGAHIDEACKTQMMAAGRWVARQAGDGETVGFTLSALYAPLGWVSWLALFKQYTAAKLAYGRGDPEPMQVFYNTRLGRTWDDIKERTTPEELQARAEPYALRSVPEGVLVLTGAVDVQDDRLEVQIEGWGEGLERWILDYEVIAGDPATEGPWRELDALLARPLLRDNRAAMVVKAVAIDSGGHHTQDVYEYARHRRFKGVFAVKGQSKPGRPVISSQPSKVDVTRRGQTHKRGAELWMIGTDTAKDWLASRWKIASGPGGVHFSQDLPLTWYQQICSERRTIRYVKGFPRTEWTKARGDRNEALDLSAYNLAAAQRLGLHKWRVGEWDRERRRYERLQSDLFEVPSVAPTPAPAPARIAAPPPVDPSQHAMRAAQPPRRTGVARLA